MEKLYKSCSKSFFENYYCRCSLPVIKKPTVLPIFFPGMEIKHYTLACFSSNTTNIKHLWLKGQAIFRYDLIRFTRYTYCFSDAHSTQAGISLPSLVRDFFSFEFSIGEFIAVWAFETLYCLSHICLSNVPPPLAPFSFDMVYVRLRLFVRGVI